MTTENQQITLRIGVFFDGTGNNRANAVKGIAPPSGAVGSYACALSNVALLHEAYPDGGTLEPDAERALFSLYVQGAGTLAGELDSNIGWYTGTGGTGVRARVEQAAEALALKLAGWLQEHPDRHVQALQFDLFGFSRGAAGARDFANDLRKGASSLLARAAERQPVSIEPALGWQAGIDINFIGLFDTVGAIIDPLMFNFSPTNGDYGALTLALAPGVARQVVQLVAGDEQRHNYPLVKTDNDLHMPGVHADLGGGYLPVSVERIDLSRVHSSNVDSDVPAEQTDAYATMARDAAAYSDVPGLQPQVRTWETPDGLMGGGKTVHAMLHREREVLGHLSRVYLRIMHALALRAEVPMQALPPAPDCWAMPEQLCAIADKLEDYALGRSQAIGLTEPQRHVLYSKYVHASANWEAFAGGGVLPADLLYLNRPAQGGRLVEPNA